MKNLPWCFGLLLFSFANSPLRSEEVVNSLSRSEELGGWKLLFNGQDTTGWRNYKQDSVSDGWKVVDGALLRSGKNAGDIITTEKYQYFELTLEYKISKGGNSGVMFHVQETDGPPWHTGPEIQVQDNVDGHDPQKAGWLYQLYKPTLTWSPVETNDLDATKPAGEWNRLAIRIAPGVSEVTMNGTRYYGFTLGDAEWKRRVAASKFANFENFGNAGEGYICLQDHNDEVAYRNIKLRKINDDGSVQQPIDGALGLKGTLAFPNLKWEGWEAFDEAGQSQKLRILELTYANEQPHRLYAMAQRGLIFTFEHRPDVTEANLFLDIEDKVNAWYGRGGNEQGLLGLAFHPKFASNGQFFVNYTRATDDATIVSRFTVSKDNPLKADRDSEEILLEVPQPYKNHNGGSIEFGPDGFLYIALGDGGLRDDPKASGQDLSQLLGKILRIDVDHADSPRKYAIPSDNPFVGSNSALPEIFAYGLRNPWRIAFDKASGRLWTGDVGQELWEEVDVIEKGKNYGWSAREGSYPFGAKSASSTTTDPVWEYDHGVGKSITGGRVYRADRIPELSGKYIYADYVSGSIWALTYDEAAKKATRNEQVIASGVPVMAFGEDASGEVYYLIDSSRGQCIYRFDH